MHKKNPLNDDYKYMRPSTIPSMMSTIVTNLNKKKTKKQNYLTYQEDIKT